MQLCAYIDTLEGKTELRRRRPSLPNANFARTTFQLSFVLLGQVEIHFSYYSYCTRYVDVGKSVQIERGKF